MKVISMNAMDGLYYRLVCMNAFVTGLYRSEEFKDDEEAIDTAANYEATLTKEKWCKGGRVSCVLLYDPAKN